MKKTRYVPPHHYSRGELADAEIADLVTDLRCAYRDGLTDYATELEAKLAEKRRARQRLCTFCDFEAGRCGVPHGGVCGCNCHR